MTSTQVINLRNVVAVDVYWDICSVLLLLYEDLLYASCAWEDTEK